MRRHPSNDHGYMRRVSGLAYPGGDCVFRWPAAHAVFPHRRINILTTPLVHLGGTHIVCPSFDVDRLFDQVETLGVTFVFAVPAMFLMMIQHPRWESLDLSNVRLVMSGGGLVPPLSLRLFGKCET